MARRYAPLVDGQELPIAEPAAHNLDSTPRWSVRNSALSDLDVRILSNHLEMKPNPVIVAAGHSVVVAVAQLSFQHVGGNAAVGQSEISWKLLDV